MNKINKTFTFICLTGMTLFLFHACTEKIDIKLDSTYTRLVVEGAITTDTTAHKILLTTTTDYYYGQTAPVVAGALVTVSDGSQTDTLVEAAPGQYQTRPDYFGVRGNTYTLQISLPTAINKQTDYSASSILHPVADIDSIGVTFHPEWGRKGFWEVNLYATDPGGVENFYLFNLYRNGKLFSDSIFKKVISDDKFFDGNYTNGIGIFFLDHAQPYQQLAVGDTITLEMSGITEPYYYFVSEVQIAGFNIPFFTGPPANVSSNITPEAVGFFTAYSSKNATTIVKKQEGIKH